jgi:hypothetical protein
MRWYAQVLRRGRVGETNQARASDRGLDEFGESRNEMIGICVVRVIYR